MNQQHRIAFTGDLVEDAGSIDFQELSLASRWVRQIHWLHEIFRGGVSGLRGYG